MAMAERIAKPHDASHSFALRVRLRAGRRANDEICHIPTCHFVLLVEEPV